MLAHFMVIPSTKFPGTHLWSKVPCSRTQRNVPGLSSNARIDPEYSALTMGAPRGKGRRGGRVGASILPKCLKEGVKVCFFKFHLIQKSVTYHILFSRQDPLLDIFSLLIFLQASFRSCLVTIHEFLYIGKQLRRASNLTALISNISCFFL